MIELTRLNGLPLVVNSDLIQYAEAAPDTTLTLVTGEKVVVRESAKQVVDLTVAWRARLMGETFVLYPGLMPLTADSAMRAVASQQTARAMEELDPGIEGSSRRRSGN